MASEYRLTGKLETGELAELFRAERDHATPVVVKLFHEKTSVREYARAIADTTNRLNGVPHPGISHVLDIGLVKRRLAIVREDSGRYTLGQVLQRLNTKEVVLTSGLAMSLVIDLLDAVTEAHAVGVVHGAMTPGNVLVSAEGRPAICDFGALAALESVTALKKTFTERGRSAYRAPELIKGEPLTIQSDVYSLGSMTYELLTLREAQGESAQISVRRDALPPPSRLDRRLNSRIDPVIMRALDPAPGRRYKSTAEFAAALREFLAANGGMPAREELKRFVDQLFPKEVQLEPSPVVPFADAFGLASVDGADLDAAEDRSLVLAPRESFSPSLDSFPAVTSPDAETIEGAPPEETDAGSERSTDWHAPLAAMPQTAKSGPKEAAADVLKRVRHIEDFEAKKPGPEDTLPQAVMSKVFPGRRDDTVAEPAESQPVSGENVMVGPDGKRRRMITEERAVAATEAAHRRWIPIVAGSALLAVGFLLLGAYRWSQGQAVAHYEPVVERPRPTPVKRPPPQPRAENPPVQPPQPRAPPVEDCYQPPRKGALGYLTVSSTRQIMVRIEGDAVCGSYTKIPLAAGLRKIVVIDTRTKEEYPSPTRIEAGKMSRLIPIFKGK